MRHQSVVSPQGGEIYIEEFRKGYSCNLLDKYDQLESCSSALQPTLTT